jgi:hypothetical protein
MRPAIHSKPIALLAPRVDAWPRELVGQGRDQKIAQAAPLAQSARRFISGRGLPVVYGVSARLLLGWGQVPPELA